MPEETTNAQMSNAAADLDAALSSLEGALVQAGTSVAVIRRSAAQLSSLADVVHEMEAAMMQARQSLSSYGQPAPPPLRPVPAYEEPVAAPAPAVEPAPGGYPQRAPQAPQPAPEAVYEEPQPEAAADAPQAEAQPAYEEEQPYDGPSAGDDPGMPAAEDSQSPSHCLRLGVASKAGSLDLKAVDGSVNENPAVVDVALLDYDGRKATLKLWINGAADPVGVRDALLGSLRRRLGDERDAEVQIEFEGAA